ncbi:MAG: MFS transporter [Thermoplasmatales archaeon]|nr:MFS transporter [Candidatus Thermoplasmatota archaeon]MCL6002669.1 MFS transporter [Candidatus Thermoplasmatota archaeon]MDA8054815.1 MFS transporter [Thermoplasmatales archaeon]
MTKTGSLKVVVASSLGTIVDYYDLFIVATAASIVWPHIFFVGLSPAAVASEVVITFGITYITRPLGAIIFGHWGDRLGRRNMMVWTMVLTAIGIGGIAALPDASVIGPESAFIIIVILRMIQGIGLGGEWPAASSLTVEYTATSKHRAFLTGWIQNGVNIGVLAASLAFTLIASVYTHSQLLDFAWRIPFIVGVIIIGFAIFIRLRISESPMFEGLKSEKKIERVPLWGSIKKKWKVMLLLIPTAFFVIGAPGIFVSGAYVLDYVEVGGLISAADASLAVAIASAVSIFFTIGGSFIGDRFGRKVTLIISSAVSAVFLYPFELLMGTYDYVLIVIGIVLLNGFFKIVDGVVPTLFAEQFETKFRFSGSGFAYQLGSLALGIVSITLIPWVLTISHGIKHSLPIITVVGIVASVLTLITAFFLTETKNKPLE